MALAADELRDELKSNGDGAGNDYRGNGTQRGSVATQLVNLCADAGVTLFHDDEDECFATIQVGDHEEPHPLESTAFRRWLIRLYDTNFKSAPNAQAIIDARATLASRAQFDGQCRNVATRVGEREGQIYIDLGDPAWSVVRICAGGWELIPYAQCPIRFRRPRGTKSMPTPVAGGSIGLLRKYMNATDDEWPLALAFVVQVLRGYGPCPVLVFRGEHGTGKTTDAKVIKELTDPSGVNIRSAPREIRDIIAATRNAHTLVFDNVSKIPDEISDAICCLSTGGGFGGRTLYTDYDEAVFTATRPVMLTSITEVVTRPDLLDRAIIISPPPFATSVVATTPDIMTTDTTTADTTTEETDVVATDAEACREAEKKFWAKFEQERALIFGAVLDALAYGLAHVDDVLLGVTTRMLDFAIWASACLPAFGIEQKTFLDAYRDNRAGANEAALEASTISPYIVQLADGAGWAGTARDLEQELKLLAGDRSRSAGFPRTPRGVRAALNRIQSNLRTLGIIVKYTREAKGVRTIYLSTVPSPNENGGKQPSLPSQPSQSTQNKLFR